MSDSTAQGTNGQDERAVEPRDFVNKKQIGRRLDVGPRKVSQLVKEDYWPDPIELSPRVLRWRWSEIEQALTERAPRRTERHEPPELAASRAAKVAPVQVSQQAKPAKLAAARAEGKA